jgi:membrane protein YdbS with pleckstrin-like domain
MSSAPEAQNRLLAARLAEFNFLHEGLRQDQRDRRVFLGFALAANAAVLGLLMRPDANPSATQALFLVGIVAILTIVAELMTVRATLGVVSTGVYLRKFVEPEVPGLQFQTMNQEYLRHMDQRVGASWGFAIAYSGLTAGFVLAWLVVDVDKCWWQHALVALATGISVRQIVGIGNVRNHGWKRVDEAWEKAEKGLAASSPTDRS